MAITIVNIVGNKLELKTSWEMNMKFKKYLITLVITLGALFITCALVYGADSSAKVDSNTYTHPSQFSNTIVLDGIDVSYWQSSVAGILILIGKRFKRQELIMLLLESVTQALLLTFSMHEDSTFAG